MLALMPHGPVELAAYSLAIALYLQDRRRNLPAAYVATVAAACVALLAIAAVLETWVTRMSPGRTLLALVAVAAGLAHRRPAALKQPAQARRPGMVSPQRHQRRPDPTGHTDPAHHPGHRTPTAANPDTRPSRKPATTPLTLTPPTANGRRHSAHAHRSPSHGQPSRNPAPRPASHARPQPGIGRSQAGCCPPRPCVP